MVAGINSEWEVSEGFDIMEGSEGKGKSDAGAFVLVALGKHVFLITHKTFKI